MEYKVVPFNPSLPRQDPQGAAAQKLDTLITAEVAQGWEFVTVSNHTTFIPGRRGCFGFGAEPGYPDTLSLMVFRR
ncbi:MAG: hypothetical protein AAFX81_19940 [Pseudomonadota bacterium]